MIQDDSSSDECTDEEEVMRDFDKEAQLVIEADSLPQKSIDRYTLVYNTFRKWQDENKTNSFDENILVCYFKDLQSRVCSATAWSIWSILKKMISTKNKIDISNYLKLKSILKNQSKGYKPKKSLVLSWEQINQFLTNAPDYTYLSSKILLIFDISGALRCNELVNIKQCHVEDLGDKSKFIVSVIDTKTYVDRTFIIGPLFYPLVKQYISLRVTVPEFTDRFFIQHINGKCQRQVIGKNKIGATPLIIESFLKLENPSKYTGHCFRRTSATLLSNSGANMMLVKPLGGWRSGAVASGYIADSVKSKDMIFNGIINENQNSNKSLLITPSTSKENVNPANNVVNNTSKKCDDDKKKVIQDLNITYEDFADEDCFHLRGPISQETIQLNSSKNFYTGNEKALPTLPLNHRNENHNSSKQLFYQKTPIKVAFTKSKESKPSNMQSANLPFSKRSRIDENLSDTDNVTSREKIDENMNTKDSVVKFENCTITGNITNNYYFYGNNGNKN